MKRLKLNQTKLDEKYRGPLKVVKVLDGNRYELTSVPGKRVLKYAHEYLRPMPRDSDEHVQINESVSEDNMSSDDAQGSSVNQA